MRQHNLGSTIFWSLLSPDDNATNKVSVDWNTSVYIFYNTKPTTTTFSHKDSCMGLICGKLLWLHHTWLKHINDNHHRIWKRSLSQIPQCTYNITRNTPFKIEICTFLFWMVCCGIWVRCIAGFEKKCSFRSNYLSGRSDRRRAVSMC